jgi:predicted nucleotidyltransferase
MNRYTILNQLSTHSQLVKSNLLYLVLSGSRAYGTDTLESDYDYRGIFINSLDSYLLNKNIDQVECNTNDIVIYELSKFIKLAKNCNPNIVELLFVDPECIVYKHPLMERILQHRDLFISKQARNTFLGYAKSQLKRIQRHKRWLDNPLQKPLRRDYNLEPLRCFSNIKLQSLNTLSSNDFEELGMDTDIKAYIQLELQYQNDYDEWYKYNTWVTNRNPERAKLEALAGYDCKHASHLIRLQLNAKEIAETGTMHTRSRNVQLLKDIRNGKYTYEELIHMSNELIKEVNLAFDKSNIPATANHSLIDDIVYDLLYEWFSLET